MSTKPIHPPELIGGHTQLALTNDMFAGVRFTGTGLTFDPKLVTFDAWQETGLRLGQMHRITGFALGDWMNYGQAYIAKPAPEEIANGESLADRHDRYLAAIALTGLDHGTLRNMASISAKYQPDERVASLTFTHHQEVAYLDKKQRSKLLEQAAAEHLTVRELRDKAPKKPAKKINPTKALAQKNAKMIQELTDIVKFLRRMKNPLILAQWYDVLYSFTDAMPGILALAEEAHKRATDQAKLDAAKERPF